FHRDAVKDDLALAADDVENQIALADRAAAGKDEHVTRCARIDRPFERLDGVLRSGEWRWHAAVLLDDRAERELVDVVDLPGSEFLARVGDFVAGGKNRDRWFGVDLDVADAERRDCANAARIE